MTFIDDVKAVVRGASAAMVDEAPDLTESFFSALKLVASDKRPVAHLSWGNPAFRMDFAQFVYGGLRSGLARTDPDRIPALLDAAVIALVLEGTTVGLDPIEQLEVERIVRRYSNGDADTIRYALELGLVVSGRPTRTGSTLLELYGRDALLWLLALELARSTGPQDPWRVSEAAVQHILEQRQDWRSHDMDEGDFPNHTTRKRLEAMGLVEVVHTPGVPEIGYRAHPEGLVLFSLLLADPPPPLVLMARGQAAPAQVPGSGPGDLDFAELVAHQLRNDLLPLRSDLETLAGLGGTDEAARLLRRALRAVARIETFADSAAQIHDLQEHLETFEIGSAIAEAIAATAHARNGRTTVSQVLDEGYVRGPRVRFVEAVIELIHNACAAGSRTIYLGVSVGDHVVLEVYDDGNGIDPSLASTVFERGVSGRSTGGKGLAFVRTLVQHHMGGRIRLRDPDRACFELRLPRFTGEE